MIEYRSFSNFDPPRLLKLWDECELGRGAARGFTCDVLNELVFAQPYWDRNGLIVAVSEADEVVGFVHAGFGPDPAGARLSTQIGVICVVMVRPDFRRRGIGRELVLRAEQFLHSQGAVQIEAGETPLRNPFYLGIYGGSNSLGFLQSDISAEPFITSMGYKPNQRFLVFQKDISQKNDPFDVRMVGIRRKMQLVITDRPAALTWWWITRQGRFDTIRFLLQPKQGGDSVAELSCWEMVLFSASQQQRTVGLTDLVVPDEDRQKGYAKTVMLETIRRLREESVTRIEMQVAESNHPTISLSESLGFEQVDTGIAYLRSR